MAAADSVVASQMRALAQAFSVATEITEKKKRKK